MTELRDLERELGRFRARLLAAAFFVLVCFALLVARLVWKCGIRYSLERGPCQCGDLWLHGDIVASPGG